MRPPFSFVSYVTLSLAMAHHAMSFTYWIDTNSCKGDKDISAIMKETQSMASRAKSKLESNSDSDFANLFKYIFKKDKTDSGTYKTVHDFMSDVSGATANTDRNSANIRIYCDNDDRWKQRKDPKSGQLVGGFEDPDNWLLYEKAHPLQTTGCKETRSGAVFTWAQTYRTPMPGDPPQKQEPQRAAITICDLTFYKDAKPGQIRKGKLLGDIKQDKDLTGINPSNDVAGVVGDGKGTIEILQVQASKILLHEWQHTLPYGGVDLKYYWAGIQSLSDSDSLKTPDCYAYLGQWALLSDRGYTLTRAAPDKSPQSAIDAVKTAQQQGKLVKYDNITKRSLMRRLARVARRANKKALPRSLPALSLPAIGSS